MFGNRRLDPHHYPKIVGSTPLAQTRTSVLCFRPRQWASSTPASFETVDDAGPTCADRRRRAPLASNLGRSSRFLVGTRSSAALAANRLSKRYGRNGPWALSGVDLGLPAGSVTALVGPNGAGKSTLLRTWMGFESPTSGTVTVFGVDPFRERARALADVAYLAQVPALYRDLSVADHIELVRRVRPRTFDSRGAERRIHELGVPAYARVGTLSGGQAAQLGLALAIGLRPRVLLLDEPLSSLDPLARREFLDVVLDVVRASGATVVLSSHIVSDIELACDRLLVLGDGRVLLDDEIATVRRTHRTVERHGPIDGLVGRIPGGADRAIVRRLESATDGQPAGLEDIVMAYLSALRMDLRGRTE